MDEKERRRFDKHMDTVRSEWGMIASARLEGREEGLEEGIEKGRQQERQKHEEEKKGFVRSLHKNGMAIGVIAESIGLSEESIRQWLEEGPESMES
ncbi:MAG: conserved hypothetical protein (putative transposase or invertase) [Candidatus Kentron sp. G]|nr:MAG: conserved hypothetical protein (putative transposase or invertase) [Candidatus Kentron sp. G]